MSTEKPATENSNTTNGAALDIGAKLARKVFAKRGNHTEAHVSEAELAALLAIAAGYARVLDSPVPASTQMVARVTLPSSLCMDVIGTVGSGANGATYVRLPPELRRHCNLGGPCKCSYCATRPEDDPTVDRWDTLVVPHSPTYTHTVHMPNPADVRRIREQMKKEATR